jgi:hypothetical protein
MHRAALNGLNMVGTSYQQKERKHITTRKHTNQGHLAVTKVLGTKAVVDDLDCHHQGATGAQNMEEPEDLNLQTESTVTRFIAGNAHVEGLLI